MCFRQTWAKQWLNIWWWCASVGKDQAHVEYFVISTMLRSLLVHVWFQDKHISLLVRQSLFSSREICCPFTSREQEQNEIFVFRGWQTTKSSACYLEILQDNASNVQIISVYPIGPLNSTGATNALYPFSTRKLQAQSSRVLEDGFGSKASSLSFCVFVFSPYLEIRMIIYCGPASMLHLALERRCIEVGNEKEDDKARAETRNLLLCRLIEISCQKIS